MNQETKEKIQGWINQHGKVSNVFLQVKLKITFNEAKKYLDEISVNILQNKSDINLARND